MQNKVVAKGNTTFLNRLHFTLLAIQFHVITISKHKKLMYFVFLSFYSNPLHCYLSENPRLSFILLLELQRFIKCLLKLLTVLQNLRTKEVELWTHFPASMTSQNHLDVFKAKVPEMAEAQVVARSQGRLSGKTCCLPGIKLCL